MRKNLTKNEIISKKSDIERVFSNNNWVSCRGMKLYYRENEYGYSRLFVTLVRKYGIAVERNRQKRYIREIFRTSKESIHMNTDLAFVLYRGTYSFADRKKQAEILFKKAKLAVFE